MTLERFERVVVDTSVVSILFRGNNHEKYEFYRQRLAGTQTTISFQTLEELQFGIYYNGWGNRRTWALSVFLRGFDVVWPDDGMSHISAQLRSETRKAGRELKSADAWIAAAALMLDCPLAADDGDFETVPNLALIRYRTG